MVCGGYAVSLRIHSKISAVLTALVISIALLFTLASNVRADASVSTDPRTWGNGGMVGVSVSNGQSGETITVVATVEGDITNATTSAGSISVDGNTITATVDADQLYYFYIGIEGTDITGISASASVSGSPAPTEPEPTVPAPTEPAPTQPTQTQPTQATPAPSQTTQTQPAQTQPAQTTATSATTAATQAPAATTAATTAAPAATTTAATAAATTTAAAQPNSNSGSSAAPAGGSAAPAAEPVATEPAVTPADGAAAPAAIDAAAAGIINADNVSSNQDNNDADTNDDADTDETAESTEETTVPIIILDEDGNEIMVTPTPTPFPRMSGRITYDDSTNYFPWKPLLISVVVIAVLAARYMVLKAQGLHGGDLALEFIPGVSDIVDKLSRKGTKIEARTTSAYDYSNSTARRAAEAAREAQEARAEFARTQQAAKASAPAAIEGVKAPVKRTAPASENAAKEEPKIGRPSPFKPL